MILHKKKKNTRIQVKNITESCFNIKIIYEYIFEKFCDTHNFKLRYIGMCRLLFQGQYEINPSHFSYFPLNPAHNLTFFILGRGVTNNREQEKVACPSQVNVVGQMRVWQFFYFVHRLLIPNKQNNSIRFVKPYKWVA